MGEMTDYYIDQQMGDEFAPPPKLPRPTATVWVTKEGQQILVTDMADSHLVNTIRYLRRTVHQRVMSEILSIGAYLDSDPPDGAYDCAQQVENELLNASDEENLSALCPTYDAMLAEAKRRKLKV